MVEHPAAKTMIEIARTQDEEVGDGTTSVVILGRNSFIYSRRRLYACPRDRCYDMHAQRHITGEPSARLALLRGTVSQLRYVNRRP